jgi:hypothetical protein
VLHVCVVPAAQTPWFMHVPATHVPFGPHVWVSVPQLPQVTMRVCPCEQTPMQTPVTHVWFMHATGLPHCPLASQVSTPLPEQVVVPGTHTPPHALLTHTYWHGWGLPQ